MRVSYSVLNLTSVSQSARLRALLVGGGTTLGLECVAVNDNDHWQRCAHGLLNAMQVSYSVLNLMSLP